MVLSGMSETTKRWPAPLEDPPSVFDRRAWEVATEEQRARWINGIRNAAPGIVKSLVEPSFTAWADGGENKPMTRAERVRFAIRNKRDEWRERLALWIAPWLASGD